MKKIHFKNYICTLKVGKYYETDRTALQLIDNIDGSPVATASINIGIEEVAEDEIAIKDYGENTGMVKALVDAEIISEPLRYVTRGYVEIPICKLLIDIE